MFPYIVLSEAKAQLALAGRRPATTRRPLWFPHIMPIMPIGPQNIWSAVVVCSSLNDA
jgi:hypothetical protein